jgi:hypothetical protein
VDFYFFSYTGLKSSRNHSLLLRACAFCQPDKILPSKSVNQLMQFQFTVGRKKTSAFTGRASPDNIFFDHYHVQSFFQKFHCGTDAAHTTANNQHITFYVLFKRWTKLKLLYQ